MEHNTTLGKNGEDAAVNWLRGKGYFIRDQRWRCGHLELDIVAQKDGMLVVVEVKTRVTTEFGEPEEAVNERKIRRIVNATDGYIKFFNLDMPVRFDIISIVEDSDGTFRINHIEDAFMSPIW